MKFVRNIQNTLEQSLYICICILHLLGCIVCILLNCWYAGCKAERLACSNTYIYVLDTSGELLVRLATASNKQWHKVPGALNTVSGNDGFFYRVLLQCDYAQHVWKCYLYLSIFYVLNLYAVVLLLLLFAVIVTQVEVFSYISWLTKKGQISQ